MKKAVIFTIVSVFIIATSALAMAGSETGDSDMKTGDPSTLPLGMGPQGDEQRIYNYVRCVRTAD